MSEIMVALQNAGVGTQVLAWVGVGGSILSVICSILASVLSDNATGMKVINALAINLGKAKNDQAVQ